jgi:hypothetical protein
MEEDYALLQFHPKKKTLCLWGKVGKGKPPFQKVSLRAAFARSLLFSVEGVRYSLFLNA